MSVTNVLANKPYITTALNNMLSNGYTMPSQVAGSITITYAGAPSPLAGNALYTNYVTITGLAPPSQAYLQGWPTSQSTPSFANALPLGTLITNAAGTSKVATIIGYVIGSTFDGSGNNLLGNYIIDVAGPLSTVLAAAGTASIYGFSTTLQNALQNILNNPIPSTDIAGNQQYSQFITTLVSVANNYNASNPVVSTGTTTGPGARIFCCMDDGTPICDTGRCTFSTGASGSPATPLSYIMSLVSSVANGVGNTYQNFSKKITITSPLYNTTNATATDVSGTIFTVGTAGGNGINENHHTRPEILLALFSNTGVGYAQRWSSSSRTNNIYIAQRIGVAPESNQGTIRLNVPVAI
jgi:hypothetical protein